MKERINKITDLVSRYAKIYAEFEEIQNEEKSNGASNRLLPKGDQKTGVIGEFYALLYAKVNYKNVELAEATNENGYDIKIEGKLISVKTVSRWAEYQQTSPVKTEIKNKEETIKIDEFWIIRLDRELIPDGFGILNKDFFIDDNRKHKIIYLPKEKRSNMQKLVLEKDNQIEDLKKCIDNIN